MWALIVIVLHANGVNTVPTGLFRSMADCFDARELLMTSAPKPKVNYEVVCVRTNLFEES